MKTRVQSVVKTKDCGQHRTSEAESNARHRKWATEKVAPRGAAEEEPHYNSVLHGSTLLLQVPAGNVDARWKHLW